MTLTFNKIHYMMTIGFLLMGNIMAAEVPKGEIQIEAAAVHPLWRSHAYPSNHEVDVNPPVFIWPSSRINFTEPLLEYDLILLKKNSDKSTQFILKTEGKGESVLTEIIQGQEHIQRCVDELPCKASRKKKISLNKFHLFLS